MVKLRSEIEEKFKWRLEDIIENNDAWNSEYAEVEGLLKEISEKKNEFNLSAEKLKKGLDLIYSAQHKVERLYVFSSMKKDEDGTNSFYSGLFSRAQSLMVRLMETTAFLKPQLLEIDENVLKGYAASEILKEYSFMLNNILREKQHILSEAEEKLLSGVGEFASGPQEIFGMLNNADLDFGTLSYKGEEYPLSHGKYSEYMQSDDREFRKLVYEQYYEQFKKHINTITSTYSNAVKADCFFAKAKKYNSAIEDALFSDNVDVSLYKALIDTVHDNLDAMHDYVELRKQLLGIEGDMEMYDIYPSLVKDYKKKYTYEDAKKYVLDTVSVLGDDYQNTVKEAFDSGWIDVYENKGKRSGAYSWGVYGTHPYVLLNHGEDLSSIYTVIHELGHAMHTYYSNASQPYPTAEYVIFVAEVASTVNEILLTKNLLAKETDPLLRKYILNHFLEQFKGTVFRQTMFAEFEMLTHEMVEKGEPLTVESMNNLYFELNKKYYGPAIGDDKTISYEWARIPHFYTSFYVYKYATGFSCATAIAKKLTEEPDMNEKYRRFLCAGGSKHPVDILADAGIDVIDAVNLCMQEFRKALKEFRELMK